MGLIKLDSNPHTRTTAVLKALTKSFVSLYSGCELLHSNTNKSHVQIVYAHNIQGKSILSYFLVEIHPDIPNKNICMARNLY